MTDNAKMDESTNKKKFIDFYNSKKVDVISKLYSDANLRKHISVEIDKETIIGKGAFGKIYQVKQNKSLVVKNDPNINSILKETTIGLLVNHISEKNNFDFFCKVLGLTDIDESGEMSVPFMVMEKIEGKSIFRYISASNLSETQIIDFLKIIFQVHCNLYQFYKVSGFVHGDLHSANILVKKVEEYEYKFKLFRQEYSFKTTYKPYIIDFGKSTININKEDAYPKKKIYNCPLIDVAYIWWWLLFIQTHNSERNVILDESINLLCKDVIKNILCLPEIENVSSLDEFEKIISNLHKTDFHIRYLVRFVAYFKDMLSIKCEDPTLLSLIKSGFKFGYITDLNIVQKNIYQYIRKSKNYNNLSDMNITQLKDLAKKYKIKGYTKFRKDSKDLLVSILKLKIN